MSFDIYIHQSHDEQGNVRPQTFVQQIQPGLGESEPVAAIKFLRPMQPRLTRPLLSSKYPSGYYSYTHPGRGSGSLQIVRAAEQTPYRLDELVRMEEISRIVGVEPVRTTEDIERGLYLYVRNLNPTIQIIVGLAMILVLCPLFAAPLWIRLFGPEATASTPATSPLLAPMAPLIILTIMAFAVLPFAWLLIRKGKRRSSWWNDARSYALQQQELINAHHGVESVIPVDLRSGIAIR